MSFDTERLYGLLPAIHRIRDAEQGYPLREFLAILAEQVAALDENIDQLYDDQFIETCAQWVVPYIGDLIGYRALHGVAPGVASSRAEVANTIRYRRRKGTAAMLEQLARDVTGWPARAVEFFERLGWTQYMNHRRHAAHYAPDLRHHERLLWQDSAFETTARTVNVRHIARGGGRHNIPNIGLFLWRLQAFALTRSPAIPDFVADPGGRLFRLDPLNTDKPLYTLPRTETEITHLAEPLDVPLAIPLRYLVGRIGDYYGPDRSVFLEFAGANPGDAPTAIAGSDIVICDLSDIPGGWAHVQQLTPSQVGLDPERGRIAFGTAPTTPVLASFHYGFARAMGGGEYERRLAAAPEPVRTVSGGAALQAELDAVSSGGSVQVNDSGRYAETLAITVDAGATVTLRAHDGARPLLASGGDVLLNLAPESTLIIDGWVISGGALSMAAAGDDGRRSLIMRHCTLVPGHQPDLPPGPPVEPSLRIAHPFADIQIEDSIVGPLQIAAGAQVVLRDSIVDATGPQMPAYHAPDDPLRAGVDLRAER